MAKPAPGPNRSGPTREELEHAAEDARTLLQQSKILQAAVAGMVSARQLYMVYRTMLDNELLHGWEVDNPQLVARTFVASAEQKAVRPFAIEELQQALLSHVIPVLAIVKQQTDANRTEERDDESESAVLPGGDTAAAAGLGAVSDAPGSDAQQAAGLGEEGGTGEAGEAGSGVP
jgi:hypothetical protein